MKTTQEVCEILRQHELSPAEDYLVCGQRIASLQVEEDHLKVLLDQIGAGWKTERLELQLSGFVRVDLVSD